MKKSLLVSLFLLVNLITHAQESNFSEENIKIGKFTEGTLTTPVTAAEHLIIFIQGSGPTDRDGNQPMLKNDGMKKMARELAENGIASYRFDKRIFKMQEFKMKEEDLVFDDFVNDVNEIVTFFKEQDNFENIIIAGHSEGSLIGMLAAKDDVDAFISLAGAGEPIDLILVEQINKMAPQLGENARTALDELKANGKTTNYNPMLESVFRPSVQPYMASWIQYDPAKEIAKLDIPVMVINGTADIQVDERQAELLAEANEEATLVLINNMNHVFREVESKDALVNTKSYNEPNTPLHPELIPAITEFIKELD